MRFANCGGALPFGACRSDGGRWQGVEARWDLEDVEGTNLIANIHHGRGRGHHEGEGAGPSRWLDIDVLRLWICLGSHLVEKTALDEPDIHAFRGGLDGGGAGAGGRGGEREWGTSSDGRRAW